MEARFLLMGDLRQTASPAVPYEDGMLEVPRTASKINCAPRSFNVLALANPFCAAGIGAGCCERHRAVVVCRHSGNRATLGECRGEGWR